VHPAAPTHGVVERFIKTVESNWLRVHHFATVAELIEALRGFKRRYNEPWLIERQGYRSPAQVRRDLTVPIPAVARTPGPESPGRGTGPARYSWKKSHGPVDSGRRFPDK
jgi:hypothetical protein